MNNNYTEYPETSTGGLILPDGRVLAPNVTKDDNGTIRVSGLMTRSEQEQLDAVLKAKFFFFPNGTGDYGERIICRAKNPDGSMRGCGAKHPYITSMCIELPFKGGTGLEAGLFAVFKVAKDPVKKQQLQGAYERVRAMNDATPFPALAHLPDLSERHPFTAHDISSRNDGDNWMAALVSYPEIITVEKARAKAIKINESNPPIRLCLKEGCDNYLEADVWCSGKAHSYL